MTYFQGETIGFYIEGNDVINLDSDTFKIALERLTPVIVINKSDMTFVSANKYYFEIPNTVTKRWSKGVYMAEILIGSSATSIGKNEAFTLLDSQIGTL
jgi:hypothetical protein